MNINILTIVYVLNQYGIMQTITTKGDDEY